LLSVFIAHYPADQPLVIFW